MGLLQDLYKIYRGVTEGDNTGSGARDVGAGLNENTDRINNALEEIDNTSFKKAKVAQNLDAPATDQVPSTQAVANRVNGIEGNSNAYTDSQLANYQPLSEKGQASGYAPLDSNAKVPAANTYAVMDEIIEGEYINATTFNDTQGNPVTPGAAKLYQDITTGNPNSGNQYRWSGSQFSPITASPGTTDDVVEGATNKYFTGARVLATVLSGLSTVSATAITAADSIISALGKLQGQINSLSTSLGQKLNKGGYTGSAQDLYDFANTKETPTGAQQKANQAEQNAKDYFDGLANYKGYQTIDLGDILTEEIQDKVNEEALASSITIDRNTLIKAIQNGEPKRWLFVGEPATYDGSATLVVAGDFEAFGEGGNGGTLNETRNAFTGEFGVNGKYGFYPDVDSGQILGELSLAENPVVGSVDTVRIPGDSNFTFPETDGKPDWNFSGNAIYTADGTQLNELTLMYVSANDIRLINRVVPNPNYTAPITPANNISNLIRWYDGTDSDQMTLNGSSGVQELQDQSPNELLVDDTSAGSPLFDTNKIVFDGAKILTGAVASQLTAANDWHGFFIFKNNANTQGDFIGNATDSNNRFFIGWRDGKLSVGIFTGTWESKGVAFTDTASFHKLEFKRVSGVATALLDDVELTDSATIATTQTTVAFHIGGNTTKKAMDYKDFFVKQGGMTTQERADMLQYINDKHGL